ncbi:MAG TPA: copper chaperone CopZ [Candidatus Avamphibacillus sp.]|nr:copper chaperone CopZ [Candidatus Avamphibacillus sp.]
MKELTLDVKGMSCAHCKSSVEGALGELDGVSSIDVNLDTGKVDVKYDEAKVSAGAMREAVEDQGYDVA